MSEVKKSFLKQSKDSIISNEKRVLYQNRYSTASDYSTEPNRKTIFKNGSFHNINLSQSNLLHQSLLKEDSSKKKILIGESLTKKPVKTIKLKSSLKSQPNQNDNSKPKPIKSTIRLKTFQNDEQESFKYQKHRLTEISNTPKTKLPLDSQLRYSSSICKRPFILNSNTVTSNPFSFNNSIHNSSRQSQKCSISPIRDKMKVEAKLAKLQGLYQNSIKNYKDILIQLQIQVQKYKLIERQRLRFKNQKQAAERTLKRKQQIICQKQQIIQAKDFQLQSYKAKYQSQFNRFLQNEKNNLDELQKLKVQLNSLSQINLQLKSTSEITKSSYEQEIKNLRNQIVKLQDFCIEYMSQKNKKSVKVQQIINQNEIMRLFDNTYGSDKIMEIAAQSNVKKTQQSSDFQAEVVLNATSELLHEKVSIFVEEDMNKSPPIVPFQLQKQIEIGDIEVQPLMFEKRKSLLDMKEVMSVDGIQDSLRINSLF